MLISELVIFLNCMPNHLIQFSVMQLLKEDEAKFKLADADADGALNLEEYNAFYHPWDHEHMHEFEIEKTLIDQDANGDGFIDIHEYMGGML